VTDSSGGVVPNGAGEGYRNRDRHRPRYRNDKRGPICLSGYSPWHLHGLRYGSRICPHTIDKVEVAAGTIYTLPIILEPAQMTAVIEVSAAALTLDTTTQTQNTTLTSDVVQDVPLNGATSRS